jgi:hypothetical protein
MPDIGLLVMSAMVLMTVHGANGPPSVADAAAQLGMKTEDIDPAFGVVPLDREKGLYAVQVPADRVPAGAESATPYSGPFSNPRIAPFGPVQTDPEPGTVPPNAQRQKR